METKENVLLNNITKNFKIFVNAINIAQSKGVYSLDEASTLFNEIKNAEKNLNDLKQIIDDLVVIKNI